MKTDLLKRVAKMEQRTFPDEGFTAIFRRIVAPGKTREVRGWCFDAGTQRVAVMRQAGETDDALCQRAAALARAQMGGGIIPRLFSL